MRIHLVFVGKTAFRDIESAIGRYLERLQHYCPVETHYIKAEKITAAVGDQFVRERESERILKLAGRQGHLIVWDQRGRELDSTGLSKFMEKLIASAISDLWMAVGGPVGVSSPITEERPRRALFFENDLSPRPRSPDGRRAALPGFNDYKRRAIQ